MADQINFKLTGEDQQVSIISLLINVLATQQATMEALVEMVAVDEKEKEQFNRNYQHKKLIYVEQFTQYLFENMADLDILNGGKPTDQ